MRPRRAGRLATVRTTADNQLLAGLPASSRAAVIAGGELVGLKVGDHLYETGEQVVHAYFPVKGTISLAVCGPGAQPLDVGLIGFEGMLGIGLTLDAPVIEFRAAVQTVGQAWRIGSAHYSRQILRLAAFRSRMNRYAYVRLLQMAQDVACRNSHRIEGRLARQLLVARDRARSNHVTLTHETLARLLGVRRAGISMTAGRLQKRELLHYVRGEIELLDAAALEATACGCYAADKRIYARFLSVREAPE
jgi:CRP-like cAMP-binding protein